MKQQNPFIYSTPDQIKNPQDALDLFVDVFKDFYLLENKGNTFIHGARGSGKSMMFRIMRPDCQKIRLNKKLNDLEYFAVYIPIKETSLNIQDIHLLSKKHGETLLNEHLMCIYFSICIFDFLRQEDFTHYNEHLDSVKTFLRRFKKNLDKVGYKYSEDFNPNSDSINDYFSCIVEILEDIQNSFTNYLARLSLGLEHLKYDGPICLFRNFLFQLIKDVGKLPFLPTSPIYLLIDDADALNEIQTQILNTWVSFRTTADVCFKITTQLTYKTYYTLNSSTRIDAPHDYNEISLSDIYTSDNKTTIYRKNIKDIVEKRLQKIYNLNTTAEAFFPSDTKQEAHVKKLEKKYIDLKNYDYAYRNARIDYMLMIPNRYTYSYAGFDQLVHLSSGIIRNFIDLAFKMFDETQRVSKDSLAPITSIPISIQNKEIKDYSSWLLQQIDKTIDSQGINHSQKNDYLKLKALIDSMGKAFRIFLESKSSERRKFSFYFDGECDEELKRVLKLGVSEGLLHYSTHGSKSGLGRAHKYVFNRMLSPLYMLDPFAFSGYLYITQPYIDLAINNPKRFLKYIRERAESNESEVQQLEFDF
nr:hypothetical protein [uncultured Arsenicibacter sp.]